MVEKMDWRMGRLLRAIRQAEANGWWGPNKAVPYAKYQLGLAAAELREMAPGAKVTTCPMGGVSISRSNSNGHEEVRDCLYSCDLSDQELYNLAFEDAHGKVETTVWYADNRKGCGWVYYGRCWGWRGHKTWRGPDRGPFSTTKEAEAFLEREAQQIQEGGQTLGGVEPTRLS